MLNWQLPLESVHVPIVYSVLPTKVTVPVGFDPVTVAMNVTFSPNFGVVVEALSAVLVEVCPSAVTAARSEHISKLHHFFWSISIVIDPSLKLPGAMRSKLCHVRPLDLC
jgi:hypothetical protein